MLLIDDDDELPEISSDEEEAFFKSIGEVGLEQIDDRILNALSDHWEKVAKVIFDAMQDGGFDFSEEIVDFHARRVVSLNGSGKLKSLGDLRKPRFSEIKSL